MKIKYRPHHFLCTVGFEGKGYSPEFIQNFTEIANTLRNGNGDDVLIEVTAHTDSICTPCPHRRDQLCENQNKISALDVAHAEILNLKESEILSWGEAKTRIKEKMTLEKFHQACEPCNWKKLGVCEIALNKLINDL